MKKIFFCVLMLTIVLRVNASLDVYSSWSDVYPSGIPKNVIQSEERYKWYKEEIIDVEYLKKEDIYNKLADYNDFKTYESEELLDEPIKFNDRVIKKEYKDYKFTKDDINYIVLENNNKSDILGISEIRVFDNSKGRELKVSVDNKYSYLLNGNKNDLHTLAYNEKVYINLNEECNSSDVRIFVYYNSSSSKNKLTILYNAHKDYPLYQTDKELLYCSLCEAYNMGITSMNETSRTYKLNVYKYIDKYYKTYRIKKTYKDEYYSSLDGYKKDLSTKKMFYRYLKYKRVYYGPNGRSESPDACFGKDSCIILLEEIEYPEIPEKIEVPKTIDNFNIIGFLISFMFFISMIVYLIKNKCRNMSYD